MRDTIDMAREAGWDDHHAEFDTRLDRLVALVRADEREQYKWDIHSCGPTCKRYACVAMREAVEAEREACAKVCEGYTDNSDADHESHGYACAAAIRGRGNT
jgi:hypothetical protein